MTIVRATGMDLTERDVARAAAAFGIREVELIGGYENALYRSVTPSGRVLRLTPTPRRSAEMVEAEFEFVRHLAAERVPVAAPFPSESGNLVEEIRLAGGDTVIVACICEARGAHRRVNEWADASIEAYGALLGAMHNAAEGFEPSGVRRPSWSDPIFDVGSGASAETDPTLHHRSLEIRASATDHRAGGEDLLIHQDAHLGNIFITDDGELTIFDFDDAAYGTPTHDLAIVLFYWLLGFEGDLHGEAHRFTSHFRRGYERVTRLPPDWPDGADRFLSYRELDIYWLLSTDMPADATPAEMRFMQGRRERILDGIPFLGVPLAEVL